MIGSLILSVVVGLLYVGLSIPLVLRLVKPNRLYGFRTAKTLANPEIWYDANAHAGKWLLGAGILTIIAALVLYFVPNLDWVAYLLVCGVIFVAGAIVSLIQSFRYLRKFNDS